MRMRWLVSAIALVGCIEPHLTICSDGRACAPDLVCDDVHQTCVTRDQLNACIGAADFTPCTAGSVIGQCFAQVCLVPGCDNRAVEPQFDEQCDDGNHVSGDGCSADCTSNETCGNGVVDSITGEACDDGNLASHDGCDSRCQIETPVWRQFPITQPQLDPALAAYDQAKRRLVAVVGVGTWEWDGTAWTFPSATSPLQFGTSALYDTDRSRVVMLGQAAGSRDAVVVEWDGAAWSPLVVQGTRPTNVARAVYDGRQHALLALGTNEAAYLDLATATWTPTTPPPFDPVADAPRVVFDQARARVVAVGAANVWEWDGTIWTTVSAALPYGFSNVVFDGTRNAVVSVGGLDTTFTITGKVFAWNGTAWGDTGAATSPRINPTIWYDAVRGSLGGVGGGYFFGITPPFDVWELAGTTLVDRSPVMPRDAGPLVYDSVRDRLLMFDAGYSGGASTWSFDGTWHPEAAAPQSPSAPIVFDPIRDGAIRFDAGTTWIFRDDWQPLAVTGPPSDAVTMLYDHDARRVVMIDSNGATFALASNDLAWQELPIARTTDITSAAYDLGNHRPVIMEGYGPVFLSELVGEGWLSSLSPGSNYAVVGGLARRSILLVPTEYTSTVLWERRGQHWASLGNSEPASSSLERSFGRMNFVVPTNYAGKVLFERQYVSSLPDETCVPDEDADGDGLAGCDDADCWWKCHPACPYARTCAP